MKKIILLLILAGMCAAQTDEIKMQYVKYGENIMQYAKVEIVPATGSSYTIPCPDCTCTANITYNGKIILKDQAMTQIEPGLFGFVAVPSALSMNKTYFMRTNTVSGSYGSGYADSQFIIVPDTTRIASATQTASDTGSLFDMGGLKSSFEDAIDYLFKPIKDLLVATGIQSLIDLLSQSKIIQWTITTLKWIATGFYNFGIITYHFILDPTKTFNTEIWPFVVNSTLWFFGLFFAYVMLAETVIIAYSIRKKDILDVLGEWFMLHIRLFTMVGSSATYLFDKTAKVLETLIRFVGAVNPLGK